jgi:hypothetical protein
MLKASKFPNTTFLDSHLGHNLSYSLRSIWFSRHILANGCMWRIGDGTKARVMHDMWLRIHGSSWIPSLQPQEVSNIDGLRIKINGFDEVL